jgi:hypothetical protein
MKPLGWESFLLDRIYRFSTDMEFLFINQKIIIMNLVAQIYQLANIIIRLTQAVMVN